MNMRYPRSVGVSAILGTVLGLLVGAASSQSLSSLTDRLGMAGQPGLDASGPARIILQGTAIPAHFRLLVWGAHHRILTIQIAGRGTCLRIVNGKAAQVQQPTGFPPLPPPLHFSPSAV